MTKIIADKYIIEFLRDAAEEKKTRLVKAIYSYGRTFDEVKFWLGDIIDDCNKELGKIEAEEDAQMDDGADA